jgi:putative two-component system response regulator
VIEREARKNVYRARRRAERERITAVVRTLKETLMARDPETAQHSQRVADLARSFGRFLGLPRAEVRCLHLAGLLHDIGKVGLLDGVLLKPGRLTLEEQRRVREHPRIAEKILSPLGLQQVVRYIAVHHENVDGSGYPDGLRGEEIPFAGRALAIVDTYDALRSRRSYKEPLLETEIRTTMREMAGGKLAPELLEKFWQFLSAAKGGRF